jgi:hypothetical protein
MGNWMVRAIDVRPNIVLLSAEERRGEMEELQDYSGEFSPDLRMQDFSKDALVGLWKACGQYALKISQYWTLAVMEEFGEEAALKLSRKIWCEKGLSEEEVRLFTDAMNIKRSGIASFLKHLQVDPGVAGFMDIECELKNENWAILTVKRCSALELCEQLGSERLQKHACEELDAPGFDIALKECCPAAKATALKLPPRKGPDDIACQWEFRVE